RGTAIYLIIREALAGTERRNFQRDKRQLISAGTLLVRAVERVRPVAILRLCFHTNNNVLDGRFVREQERKAPFPANVLRFSKQHTSVKYTERYWDNIDVIIDVHYARFVPDIVDGFISLVSVIKGVRRFNRAAHFPAKGAE